MKNKSKKSHRDERPVCIALSKEESEILLITLYKELGENHLLTQMVKNKLLWHRNSKRKNNDSLGDFGESEKVTNIYRKKGKR